VLVTLVLAGVAVVASGILVLLLSRWLQSEGARQAGSSGVADAFGNFIDVFDPARARADRDLKEHHNAGPVTRTPDDEDDDQVTLIPGPDGLPRTARIRRQQPPRRT
jgi:hypothetical protein